MVLTKEGQVGRNTFIAVMTGVVATISTSVAEASILPVKYNVISFGENGYYPRAINNNSTVVGRLPNDTGFKWSPASWTLATGAFVGADINEDGFSAGRMNNGGGFGNPFNPAISTPGGVVTLLSTNPGEANAINDGGMVVGTDYSGNTFKTFIYTPQTGYTIYNEAQGANDVNNNGMVVGWQYGFNFNSRASKWTAADGWSLLAGNAIGNALAVNDSGVIVGGLILNGVVNGAIWTPDGNYQTFDSIEYFFDINNNGLAVSFSGMCTPKIYHSSFGFRDILPLIGPEFGVSQICYPKLNDKGQIISYGVVNGVTQAILLDPVFGHGGPGGGGGGGGAVPEPATWATLIAGFGLTGAAMRRRRATAAVA